MTRRFLLSVLSLTPALIWARGAPEAAPSVPAQEADDFVILDGWVLKKSDLARLKP